MPVMELTDEQFNTMRNALIFVCIHRKHPERIHDKEEDLLDMFHTMRKRLYK